MKRLTMWIAQGLCSALLAGTIQVGEAELTYSVADGAATITEVAQDASGRLEFPAEIEGVPVRTIGANAAAGCTRLTEIIVPNSVTNIRASAFANCSSVMNMALPFVGSERGAKGVTFLGYVFGASSYSYNSSYVPASLTTLEITDDVQLGSYALYNCTRIRDLRLPASLTTYASSSLSGLQITNLTISGEASGFSLSSLSTYLRRARVAEGSRAIVASLFAGCRNLVSVEIPESVTEIGVEAFANCTALTELSLPDSLQTIGALAYSGCSGLMDVTVPENVRSVGYGVFQNCSYLTNMCIPFVAGYLSTWFSNSNNNRLYVPWTLKHVTVSVATNIPSSAFSTCVYLERVDCANAVLVGASAFEGCENLRRVVTSPGLMTIGDAAFRGCRLLDFDIPDSVESIGSYAFMNCTNMVVATLSDGLQHVGDSVFTGTRIDLVDLPPNLRTIGANAFASNRFEEIVLSNVVSIGDCAFKDCTNVRSVVLGPRLQTIGREAFLRVSRVTDLVVPDSVGRIESSAFMGWSSLTNLVIPFVGNYRGTGNGRFYWIFGSDYTYVPRALETVTVTSDTAVESYAFEWCSNLKKIVLPKTLTGIGTYAFRYCSSLQELEVPFVGSCRGGGSFRSFIDGCASLKKVVVTDDTALAAYAFQSCGSLVEVVLNGGVTDIGTYAFDGCRNLSRVTVPATVTSIGAYAFNNCTSLRELELPEAVKVLPNNLFDGCASLGRVACAADITEVGTGAFYGCTALTNLTAFTAVETIGASAFYNCQNLDLGKLPASLTTVGSHAFYGMNATSEVSIPRGTTTIAADQYNGMRGVRRLVIPEGVTNILDSAFSGCTNLVEISFPSTLQAIGPYAFQNCRSLGDVFVPTNVVRIDYNAFENCSALTNMVLPFVGKNRGSSDSDGLFGFIFGSGSGEGMRPVSQYYSGSSASTYVLPQGLRRVEILDESLLGWGAFSGCPMIREVVLHDTVSSMAGRVFCDSTGLEDLRLPRGISRIESETFLNCSALGSIEIPVSVQFMAEGVFRGCSSLTNMVIPFIGSKRGNGNGADSVFGWIFGSSSWSGAEPVSQEYYRYVNYYGTLQIYSQTYYVPTNGISVKVQEETRLNQGAFDGCRNIWSLEIGGSMSRIEDFTFRNCASLEVFRIPAGVTEICSNAFFNCRSLSHVAFSDELKRIGSQAFRGCQSLEAGRLPEGLETIGIEAFAECCGLRELSLPSTLVEIGRDAFFCCENLMDVNLPNGLGSLPSDLFRGCYGITHLTLGSGVTNIQAQAFMDCSNIVDVTIPANVSEIGNDAFRNCVLLRNVDLPASMRTVGNAAFANCVSLTNLHVAEGTEVIRTNAFADCTALVHVSLPETLLDIGDSAFERCGSLESLTVPNGVTNIGASAFRDCTRMANPVIGMGVVSIGDTAFKNCRSIDNVFVPTNVQTIGSAAFAGCCSLTNMVLPFVGSSRTESTSRGSVLGHLFDYDSYQGGTLTTLMYANPYYSGSSRNVSQYIHGSAYLPTYLRSVEIQDASMICDGAFLDCMSLKSVRINEGVRKIGAHAFQDCWQLTEFSIPATVASLDKNAFDGMSSIRAVTMPSGLNATADIFSSFATITNIVITSNSTVILKNEFAGCTSLTSLTIPVSVTSMGNEAFRDCTSLTNVTYLGNAPVVGGKDLYEGTPATLVSSVREGSTGWDGDPFSEALPADGMWPTSITGARRIAFAGSSADGDPTGSDDGPSGGGVDGPTGGGSAGEVVLDDESPAVTIPSVVGAACPTLPEGMVWDPATGTLDAASAEPGRYDVFFVKDGRPQRYTVVVPGVVRTHYDFVVGEAANVDIPGAVGYDAYSLPSGLVWDAGAGVVFGTPLEAGSNTVYFVTGYGEQTEIHESLFVVATGVASGDELPPAGGQGGVPTNVVTVVVTNMVEVMTTNVVELVQTNRVDLTVTNFVDQVVNRYVTNTVTRVETNVVNAVQGNGGSQTEVVTVVQTNFVDVAVGAGPSSAVVVPPEIRMFRPAAGFTGAEKKILSGIVCDAEGNFLGLVQVTTGKAGAKGVKAGGFVMLSDGRKQALKAVTVPVQDGYLAVSTAAGKIGTADLVVGADGFAGTLGDRILASAVLDDGTGVLKGSLSLNYIDAAGKVRTRKITLAGVAVEGGASGQLNAKGQPAKTFSALAE